MSRTEHHTRLRKMAYAGFFLALALILPLFTAQIPQIGQMLLPMHLPVLLCGFVCGWQWGFAVGASAPIVRYLIFGMPPIFPTGASMAFELAAYAVVAALLYRRLPKKLPWLYVSLISAMLAGRLVWGAVRFAFAGLNATAFPFSAFWAGAFAGSLPGIALQIAVIPPLVLALRKAGFLFD